MALSSRKKVPKHTHSSNDVKDTAEYNVERAPSKTIPASDVVIASDEDVTTYLSNMSWGQNYGFLIRKTATSYDVLDKTGIAIYNGTSLDDAFNWITTNYTPTIIVIADTSEDLLLNAPLAFIDNLVVENLGAVIKANVPLSCMVNLQGRVRNNLMGLWILKGDNKANYCIDVSNSTSFSTEIVFSGNITCQGYIEAGLKIAAAEDVHITGKMTTYGWIETNGASNGKYGVQVGEISVSHPTMGINYLDNITSARNKIADIFIKDVLVVQLGNVLLTTKGDWTGEENFLGNIVISGWQYGCDVKITGGWIEGKNKPQIVIIGAKSRKLELVNPHISNEGTGPLISSALATPNLLSFKCTGGQMQMNSSSDTYLIDIAPDNFYLEGTEYAYTGTHALVNKANWTSTTFFIRWLNDKAIDSNEIPEVENYSFELPSSANLDPQGWIKNTYAGSGLFERVADCVDGLFAMKITNSTSSSRCSVSTRDFVSVQKSQTYLLSAYAKSSSALRKARLFLLCYDINGVLVTTEEVFTMSPSWTRISKIVTTASNVVRAKIECGTEQAAYSAYFDYIKLVEIRNEGSSWPANPTIGDIFYHTSYHQAFRYDPSSADANVNGWAPLTRITHQGTTAQRLAASIAEGDFWFDMDQSAMYQYVGGAWTFMGYSTALNQNSAPTENLIKNAGFEDDYNNDSIPDYWIIDQQSGTGSIARYATDQVAGKYSMKVTSNTNASATGTLSDTVPVDPTKPLYYEVWAKPQYTGMACITVKLHGYSATKTWLGQSAVVNKVSQASGVWTKYSGTITPSSISASVRYVRLDCQCDTPSTYPAYVLYDGVILSLQRAIVSTNRTINGSNVNTGGTVAVSGGIWTNIYTIAAASLDTEDLTVNVYLFCNVAGFVQMRIYDATDDVYYPLNAGYPTSCVILYGGWYHGFPWIVTIPKNINGHSLQIQVNGSAGNYFAGEAHWGSSPHTHA